MPEIRLKERCKSCDGAGAYRSPADPGGVPCWTCEGRGWVYRSMRAPDPQWRRLWIKYNGKRGNR